MEEDNAKISILLATYNGEKYITEQLISLLNQTYQNFEVVIRDDGSKDSTLDIINQFMVNHPNKIRLLNDTTKHKGPRDGFMYMLQNVDNEYYMFCDQDDVWLPNKIELSINKLKKIESGNPNLPVMVHTDLIVVDDILNTIYPSFFKWGKFNVDLNKKMCFAPFGNVFTGCTMIFNNALKKYLFPIPDFIKMHDQWIGLMAVKYGKVDNIKIGTIKYRQHGGNVCSTGKQRRFSLGEIFKKNNWYNDIAPILKELGYGSKLKAYFFKFIYSGSRVFYHN